MFSDGMWIFYLESALALGMFVFIVWWTLPKKPRDSEQVSEQVSEQGSASDPSRDAGATPGAGQAEPPGNLGNPGNPGKPQDPHS